jgi:hypothetical protein
VHGLKQPRRIDLAPGLFGPLQEPLDNDLRMLDTLEPPRGIRLQPHDLTQMVHYGRSLVNQRKDTPPVLVCTHLLMVPPYWPPPALI